MSVQLRHRFHHDFAINVDQKTSVAPPTPRTDLLAERRLVFKIVAGVCAVCALVALTAS